MILLGVLRFARNAVIEAPTVLIGATLNATALVLAIKQQKKKASEQTT
ncbi:hypothetical protein [Priestia filamentosa]|nr:hypothetical protein [Priestia filamentosa]